ncbi:hypothetical protein ACWERY_29805 [Streptomyces sp. NPDC004082]|uniref:hypothetical protein n=1 Tax=unclassified Streptomyces TaxID=2593676 RepID=UPI0033AC27D4
MTRHPSLSTDRQWAADCLEGLRQQYEDEVLQRIGEAGRVPCVAAYVLARPGFERHADLDLIRQHAATVGWRVAGSSFADVGQPPPLAQRPGFAAACRYAVQGYAHGILAIARPAITTDDDTYAQVLEHLHARSLFLAYLPALGEAVSP